MNNEDIRFVAHLDILGMSTIVDNDLDDVWGMLSDLVEVKDNLSNIQIEIIKTQETANIKDKIHTVTFSDTIVLFTAGNTDTELHCMIVYLTEIFHKAMVKCVPIRVGLAVGKFYFNLDKSMYAGPALIEAYRIGESSQWLGISLGESVHQQAIKLKLQTTNNSNIVINWDIPQKKDKSLNGYVINWPALFANDFTADTPITTELFYEGFKSSFGNYDNLPSDVKIKYTNTVNFINQQLGEHKKPKSGKG